MMTPPDNTSSSPSGASSTPLEPLTVPTTQQIVEKYLPSVQWLSPVKGLCLCPGRAKHTSKSTKKDCAVFLDGKVPTVYCFHQNCQVEVEAVNDDIRAAWRYFQPEVSAEERQKLLEDSSRRHELESRALAAKATILEKYKWNIFGEALNAQLPEQFRIWRDSLWRPTDVIWCGEPHNSGAFFHRNNFMLAEDATAKGHFSSASTYRAGNYSRSNDNVVSTPFLIVEGDAVFKTTMINENDKHDNKLACAAIFNWLRKEMKLNLRAIVDSANKSLHGWFDMPDVKTFEQLKVMLPIMGCDKAMFKPSQPARLPGVLRDNGNEQRLLYIA